jgi:hypothetical protein
MMRIAATLVFLILTASASFADPPHVQNPDKPRAGVHLLELRESWHRGHEEDDIFFGAIRTVQLGPDDKIYALDTQKSEVAVFDRAGKLLRYLSREGEGPGESRRPEDLIFLPDGNLGIVQYINGRIVVIDLEGIPQDTMMPPGFDPLEGGSMTSIRRARYRGGTLVVNGARVAPDGDSMKRTQYLMRCDAQLSPLLTYLERTAPMDLRRDGWIEKLNYFPSHERWDIDAQGRVLAAAERNEYLVTVYEQDGSIACTFGREYRPWRRTEEEKQEIRDSLTVLRGNERIEVPTQVEDTAPAIQALYCRPDGEVWVLPSTGTRDQPEGVMLTFDVFSAQYAFVRQEAISCPGDPEEDVLFPLDGGTFALVRGAVQARRNTFGGSRGEEKEIGVHDLLIFEM